MNGRQTLQRVRREKAGSMIVGIAVENILTGRVGFSWTGIRASRRKVEGIAMEIRDVTKSIKFSSSADSFRHGR